MKSLGNFLGGASEKILFVGFELSQISFFGRVFGWEKRVLLFQIFAMRLKLVNKRIFLMSFKPGVDIMLNVDLLRGIFL